MVKVQFTLEQATEADRGSGGLYLYSFFNLGARSGGWWTPRPDRFTPQEREPVPIIQEAGWTSGPVWTGAENLALTGIRYTEREIQ
jgi:hypothetical protein